MQVLLSLSKESIIHQNVTYYAECAANDQGLFLFFFLFVDSRDLVL